MESNKEEYAIEDGAGATASEIFNETSDDMSCPGYRFVWVVRMDVSC